MLCLSTLYVVAGDIPFSEIITIDPEYNAAASVQIADIDGDGDGDIVCSSEFGDEVTWFENTNRDGSNWVEHTLTTTSDATMAIWVADIDGDQDLDIAAAAMNADQISWWENNGDGSGWTEHVVAINFSGARSVIAADFDGDQDMDLAGTAHDSDTVTWWENTNGVGTSWSTHVIDGNFDGGFSLTAADFDGDQDIDLAGAANIGDDFVWWENINNGSSWTEHPLNLNIDGPTSVHAVDLDGDQDMDIVGTASIDDVVMFWENTNNGAAFVEHTVASDLNGAHSVHAADFDLDGDMDLVGCARVNDRVRVYENDGTPADGGWMEYTLTKTFRAPVSVFAGDLDADGDPDIATAARNDSDISWFRNEGCYDSLDSRYPLWPGSVRIPDLVNLVNTSANCFN